MKTTFGSLFFLCPWQAPLHRQRSVRLGRNRWTWPLSRWGTDPLKFHITREKFYGVRCNQVESKIRAGNLVRSASWNLRLHVGKRGGIVRESSKGGTHCSTLQIFERVSEERLVFQKARGDTVHHLTRGTWIILLRSRAATAQPTPCKRPCKRWWRCQQADGPRMTTYISYCTDLNNQQYFCLFDPAELPKRSRLGSSPADYSRSNSFAANTPSALLEGNKTASLEDASSSRQWGRPAMNCGFSQKPAFSSV